MLLSALFEPRDIKNRAARKEKPRERNSTLHCKKPNLGRCTFPLRHVRSARKSSAAVYAGARTHCHLRL